MRIEITTGDGRVLVFDDVTEVKRLWSLANDEIIAAVAPAPDPTQGGSSTPASDASSGAEPDPTQPSPDSVVSTGDAAAGDSEDGTGSPSTGDTPTPDITAELDELLGVIRELRDFSRWATFDEAPGEEAAYVRASALLDRYAARAAAELTAA